MGCRNCARTVVVLTVLAPLLSLVVLGVSHNKGKTKEREKQSSFSFLLMCCLFTVAHPGHINSINSKTAQKVVGHVKKQVCSDACSCLAPSVIKYISFLYLQSNVITDSHGSLLFDPPLLDFGDW